MGRLRKPENIQNISGDTLNIYSFIDEDGNVIQIDKDITEKGTRLKYYIDPDRPAIDYVGDCVIGVSDAIDGDCTYGIGLGIGDDTWARARY